MDKKTSNRKRGDNVGREYKKKNKVRQRRAAEDEMRKEKIP